jgi:hypothetical protein
MPQPAQVLAARAMLNFSAGPRMKKKKPGRVA